MAVTGNPFSLRYKIASCTVLLLLCTGMVLFRLQVLDRGTGEGLCAGLTAASCVILILLALPARKKFSSVLPHGLPSVTFGSSIAGLLLLTVLPVSIYYGHFAPIAQRVTDVNGIIALLMKGLGILSAVYFLATAAYMALPQKRALHLFLTMMPALYFAFRILNEFINNSAMPLANSGGYRMLGMIAAMLFFLCEGKICIGKGNVTLLLATGAATVLLCSMYAIPCLLNRLQGTGTELNAFYAMLALAISLYILTRMMSIRPLPETVPAA